MDFLCGEGVFFPGEALDDCALLFCQLTEIMDGLHEALGRVR